MTDSAALRQLKSNLGLTWREMSAKLGVCRQSLTQIACSKCGISARMAQRIEDVFGVVVPTQPHPKTGRPLDTTYIGAMVLRIGVPRLTKLQAKAVAEHFDREGWPWRRAC
jgi:transcriptional regulator with XRE-family HTH domain